MKPGTKLKSTVCDTEVMVIRGTGGAVVECGGVPMLEERPAERGTLKAGWDKGTQIGKRYVDMAGSLELLCVKAGQGSLSMGGVALRLKEAKPLPASD